MSTIRIATIGTSMITGRFLDAVRQTDGIQATVVYSRDAERAAAFADEQGIGATSSDLAELLDSGDVDAVYVGSPNGKHVEQALAALRAGRHVFVEKPAAPTAAEFEALVEEAADTGVIVFEGMRNAYDPGMDEIRALLPRLGTIRRAAFTYCQRSARYDRVLAGERVNIFDPALAGGALLDLGVYCVSPMVDLFGEPEAVRAVSVEIAGGADGTGSALLSYPGFLGEVTYSKITVSARPSEIQGELATLEIDRIAEPSRLRLHGIDGSVEDIELNPPENNMVFEVQRFVDLMRGGDPAPDNARTLSTLRVVEAIAAG